MTDDEKLTFLRNKGFYSVKALQNAEKDKLDEFEKFLENEVTKISGLEVKHGYTIRTTEDGRTYFMLPKGYEV